MTMDLLSGELNRFTPVVDDFGLENLFSSNPDYDEASGPPRDDRFIPIEDFYFDDWDEDDEADYWDRILFQDPDEPLGPGETLAMVREEARYGGVRVSVAPGYQPVCGPQKTAIRNFTEAELKPVQTGVVPVTVKKFDRKAKRFVRTPSSVLVTVVRHKAMEPH